MSRELVRVTVNPYGFEAVERILRQAHALVGAADSHGLLCGMSCSGLDPSFDMWVAQVLADTQPSPSVRQECSLVLASVYQESLRGLYSPDLEFQPLLPGEEAGLGLKAAGLGKWCEGFLYGLGLGGINDAQGLTKDVQEILKDLGEISRIQFEIEGPVEEAEQDYVEVLEFVRAAVLLMSEELRITGSPTQLQ